MSADKFSCASGLPCEVRSIFDNGTGKYHYIVYHIPTCSHATDYITQLRNERNGLDTILQQERARLHAAYQEKENLKKQLEQERLAYVRLSLDRKPVTPQVPYNEPVYEQKKQEKHVCNQHDVDQMISTVITKYKRPALTVAAIVGAYMFRTDIMFMVIAGAAVFSYISYCRCKDPFNLMGNKK